MIGTGAMTDPYIPLERKIENVRESLELIYRYGFGFTCITKSDLVLRDIEILKKINDFENYSVLIQPQDDFCEIYLKLSEYNINKE